MLSVVGALTSCAVNRDDLVTSFQSANPEATDEQASCVVDALINVHGIEGVEQQLALDPVDPAFEELQFRTMVHCGMTGQLEVALTQQVAGLDVAADNRACVVDALVADITDDDLDVLLSGQITDDYYAKFFDTLSSCDALP
ncbi:MAG: hypothetical protein R2706_02395 [Acidimicrobiales bacterium]